MKYYKAFDSKLKCRGLQFEVGQEYEGFRFDCCTNILAYLRFTNTNRDSRFCEVEPLGEIKKYNDHFIQCSKIKIVRELDDIKLNGTIVDNYGDKRTYVNGLLNSIDDEPALVTSKGDKVWYKSGMVYRDSDKPSWIDYEGNQYWVRHSNIIITGKSPFYIKGDLYRKNGKPTIIDVNGNDISPKRWCCLIQ